MNAPNYAGARHELKPSANIDAPDTYGQLTLATVTHPFGHRNPGLDVLVFLRADTGCLHMSNPLTPEEARQLAFQLCQCADAAEANRERHESYEEAKRYLEEHDGDSYVTIVHPDVYYVDTPEQATAMLEAEGFFGTVIVREPQAA